MIVTVIYKHIVMYINIDIFMVYKLTTVKLEVEDENNLLYSHLKVHKK